MIDPATENRNGLLLNSPRLNTDLVWKQTRSAIVRTCYMKEMRRARKLTCDRQLNALNISKKTKQVNVMVVSRGVTMLSLICKSGVNQQTSPPILSRLTSRTKMKSVPQIIIAADINTFKIRLRVIMGWFTLRGGCLRTSGSTGSTPRLCAGGPSMMILIHRICMAFNGLG